MGSVMTAHAVIARAKKLLAKGQIEKAQDLLLDAGYNQLDSEVQQAYVSLFPPSNELTELLAGSLKDLTAADLSVRLKASRWIEDQARDFPTADRGAWLKDPRTVELLLAALDDPDKRIVENAASALKNICFRYYPDRRAYPAFLRMLGSSSATMRYYAVEGVATLGGNEGIDHILPLLNDRAAKVRAEVPGCILQCYMDRRLSRDTTRRLQQVLATTLTDRHPDVRTLAASCLREFGDQSVMANLKSALRAEKNAGSKESLLMAIEFITKREAVR